MNTNQNITKPFDLPTFKILAFHNAFTPTPRFSVFQFYRNALETTKTRRPPGYHAIIFLVLTLLKVRFRRKMVSAEFHFFPHRKKN